MNKNLWCTISDGNQYWFQIFRNAPLPNNGIFKLICWGFADPLNRLYIVPSFCLIASHYDTFCLIWSHNIIAFCFGFQADWSSIRRDFPSLNAAQVQQILSKYQLGNNQARPKGWFPPHDQVESALKTGWLELQLFVLYVCMYVCPSACLSDLSMFLTYFCFKWSIGIYIVTGWLSYAVVCLSV